MFFSVTDDERLYDSKRLKLAALLLIDSQFWFIYKISSWSFATNLILIDSVAHIYSVLVDLSKQLRSRYPNVNDRWLFFSVSDKLNIFSTMIVLQSSTYSKCYFERSHFHRVDSTLTECPSTYFTQADDLIERQIINKQEKWLLHLAQNLREHQIQ